MAESHREIEHNSTSSASFTVTEVSPTSPTWPNFSSPPSDNEPIEATTLSPGSIIRVQPMNRQHGGWDDSHFSPDLTLPPSHCPTNGMIVTFEGMGRECIAIALSPQSQFVLGKTYVVHFGANGNLSTVLRRREANGTEAVDASFPSSKVCSERHWNQYWVCIYKGKLSAGFGGIPGKECIGSLNDSLYDTLRTGPDAVRCVGIGNSVLGYRNVSDLKVRKMMVCGIPVGMGEALVMEKWQGIVGGGRGASLDDKELLEEYERECIKARARAEKFEIEYKEPAPDAFLKWSEARRLRANPGQGFITGIDMESEEERRKREARKERFMEDFENKRKLEEGYGDQENGGIMKDAGEDTTAFLNGEGGSSKEEAVLPIVQAWDNEELVRQFRVDPPSSLTKQMGGESTKGNEEEMESNLSLGVLDTTDQDMNAAATDDSAVSLVPEKIHIFAIDWAAFKQIRSEDIMEYFAEYGPSYVEWLGELTCNVHFQDRFSAARALAFVSQELPSPPPRKEDVMAAGISSCENDQSENKVEPEAETEQGEEEKIIPDLGGMGWTFCKRPIRKRTNDKYGRRGTTSRVLFRTATSLDYLEQRPTQSPRPPPGFTTKRILGPGSDFDTSFKDNKQRKKKRRKKNNNGKRNKNNNSNSMEDQEEEEEYYEDDDEMEDYEDGEQDDNQNQRDKEEEDNQAGATKTPRGLNESLKCSRPGFSVEELEKERTAKKEAVDQM